MSASLVRGNETGSVCVRIPGFNTLPSSFSVYKLLDAPDYDACRLFRAAESKRNFVMQ